MANHVDPDQTAPQDLGLFAKSSLFTSGRLKVNNKWTQRYWTCVLKCSKGVILKDSLAISNGKVSVVITPFELLSKGKKRQYEASQLFSACHTVRTQKMPIRTAARIFHVPEATVRGMLSRQVRQESANEETLPTFGPDRLFNESEEIMLVNHLSHMNKLGYEYYIRQISRMALDYAIFLGKKSPSDKPLSTQWYHTFHARWPEVGYQKTLKLATLRAKSTSKEVVDAYYSELKSVFDTHSLLEQPDSIYILDEITLPMEHNAESVYCGGEAAEGETSVKQNKAFSIIGCGNASGSLVPPYLILPGKRWNEKYLEGTCQGSSGECSEKGLCHSLILKNYFQTHFNKFVPVGKKNQSTLVMYDGHRLHPSLTLKSWAEENSVIFFVLPPHTSVVTRLDMGCFMTLKAVYTKECINHLRRKQCLSLTNFDAGVVGSNAYLKAMTPLTLSQSFRRIGIYPFGKTVTDLPSVSDHEPIAVAIADESDENEGNIDISGESL